VVTFKVYFADISVLMTFYDGARLDIPAES